MMEKQTKLELYYEELGIKDLTDEEVKQMEMQQDWNDTLERAGNKLFEDDVTD